MSLLILAGVIEIRCTMLMNLHEAASQVERKPRAGQLRGEGRHKFTILRLVSVVTLFGTTAHAQQFGNAGYEAPVLPTNNWASPPPASPGLLWQGSGKWGIANGTGSWGTGGHSGSQYGFLQSYSDPSPGTMFQTVSGFTIGNRYNVNFWMARRNGNVGGNAGTSLTINVDD